MAWTEGFCMKSPRVEGAFDPSRSPSRSPCGSGGPPGRRGLCVCGYVCHIAEEDFGITTWDGRELQHTITTINNI